MSTPLLHAVIGEWLARIHTQESTFIATFATTDSMVVVVTIRKADILLTYEGPLLSKATVTPHKIDFVGKAFELIPDDQRPKQFFWSSASPTESELKKERLSGTHPRRIWYVHPGKMTAASV